MNRSNISWVDNKVFNPGSTQSRPSQTAPQMQPFMDTMPAQTQAMPAPTQTMPAQTQTMPASPAPTGVSPSTFQAPTAGMPNQNVSPSAYQAPMTSMPEQSGLSPATYQEPMTKNPGQMGTSPSTYQADMSMDPARMGVAMPVRQAPGTEGTQTRTDAYAPSPFNMQGPPTVFSPGYTPAYLKSQIGKRVRAEFNIGTNLYMDRTGILREVGVSYFVLEDNVTHAMVMCDLYSLKFLTSV